MRDTRYEFTKCPLPPKLPLFKAQSDRSIYSLANQPIFTGKPSLSGISTISFIFSVKIFQKISTNHMCMYLGK